MLNEPAFVLLTFCERIGDFALAENGHANHSFPVVNLSDQDGPRPLYDSMFATVGTFCC